MMHGTRVLLGLMVLMLSGCVVVNQDRDRGVIVEQKGPVYRTALRTFTTDYGKRLVLSSDFLFDVRSNRLIEGYERTLIDVFDTIIENEPYSKLWIQAYTDSRPSQFDAEYLTQMQADRVASYLWASGIPKDKITILGMGDKKPVSSNLSTTGQADNRRIEILIFR